MQLLGTIISKKRMETNLSLTTTTERSGITTRENLITIRESGITIRESGITTGKSGTIRNMAKSTTNGTKCI